MDLQVSQITQIICMEQMSRETECWERPCESDPDGVSNPLLYSIPHCVADGQGHHIPDYALFRHPHLSFANTSSGLVNTTFAAFGETDRESEAISKYYFYIWGYIEQL